MTEVPRPRQPEEIHKPELANWGTRRSIFTSSLDLLNRARLKAHFTTWVVKYDESKDGDRWVTFKGKVGSDNRSLLVFSEAHSGAIVMKWEDDRFKRTDYAAGQLRMPDEYNAGSLKQAIQNNALEETNYTQMYLSQHSSIPNDAPRNLDVQSADIIQNMINDVQDCLVLKP